jgi:hypothetical protein
MRLMTMITAVLLAATAADAAKWETPGSEMWGACAYTTRQQTRTRDAGFNAGLCTGTINAIVFTKDDICMPEGVSREQAEGVVLRYFELHRELLHLDGVVLVHQALREAWPCQR